MPTGFPDYYGGLTLPLTVAEGGTGYTSIAVHNLMIGNGSGVLSLLAPGAAGQVLTANGPNADPSWQTPSVSAGNVSGILAIANGGTGTSTPGLVAGAGISITGSWPDQTITNTDDAYFAAGVLSIVHGGTGLSALGTAYQALQVNSTATALVFDAVHLDQAGVTGILPIANGGTGTSTPSLVAGTGIGITGSWPNQTITNTSTVKYRAGFVQIAASATSGTYTYQTALPAGTYIGVVVPTSDPGSGMRYWVSGVSNTAITVNLSAAAPGAGLSFWFIVMEEIL